MQSISGETTLHRGNQMKLWPKPMSVTPNYHTQMWNYATAMINKNQRGVETERRECKTERLLAGKLHVDLSCRYFHSVPFLFANTKSTWGWIVRKWYQNLFSSNDLLVCEFWLVVQRKNENQIRGIDKMWCKFHKILSANYQQNRRLEVHPVRLERFVTNGTMGIRQGLIIQVIAESSPMKT